jgi:hypothetical protein
MDREPGQAAPPTWPAKVLQKIARYVFETENKESRLTVVKINIFFVLLFFVNNRYVLY